MLKDELITIVVPVFHVEKFLQRCLKSISQQTYENLEIILVDDGSDDNCSKICDSLVLADSRIKVVHQKNGGLSSARNSGIDIASGKFIAFVDSDDCISEYFIEYLYYALIDTDADLSQCSYTEYSERTSPVFEESYVIPKEWDKFQTLESQFTNGTNIISTVAWNKLYKIELFSEIRYADGKLHEDEFTTYKLFDIANKVAYIDIPLYGYFQNINGIMHASMKVAHIDGLEAKLERYSYYLERHYTKLLSMAATNCFDTLLDLSKNISAAVDKEKYSIRLNEIFARTKKTIRPVDLSRHNRTVLKISDDPNSFNRSYKWYLTAGKISKFLHIAKIRTIKANKIRKKAYVRELNRLFENYDSERTVFIIGSIEYDNLGDHAIVMAQHQFIQRCLPNCKIIEIRDDLYKNVRHELKQLIKPDSIITIPGGGNMGNIWFDDEQRRRWIIEDYPHNRIIVFPQTIDYSDTEEGMRSLVESKHIYEKHDKLILCAREQYSFEQMKATYKNADVVLVPDIVLSLNEHYFEERSGVLICLRKDKEKKTEWSILNTVRLTAEKIGFKYRYTDTMSPTNVSLHDREKAVAEKMREFALARLVITDRLHGMIFAVITGTPCIVLPNKNHKVKGVYLKWLSECEYLNYAESITEDTIIEMYTNTASTYEFNQTEFIPLKEILVNG